MYYFIVPAMFPSQKPGTEPPSWSSFFLKLLFGFVLVFVFMIVVLWARQESMLYVPKAPNQDFEDNHEGFCNPTERGMKYKDIFCKTKDGVQLHGWHITANDFTTPKDTAVFMHENTGNLGQRLEFFDLLVKKIGVNVVCFAYRGYSKSKGKPSELGL
jgi:hypothetical protein